jgi:hypothetical protein
MLALWLSLCWGAEFSVPQYVQPGARFVYSGGGSTEGAPGKTGSAGLGLTTFDVAAVTGDKVLVHMTTYLQVGQGHTNIGTAGYAMTAMTVSMGDALWMSASELNALESGSGVEVVRGPYPLDGRPWDSVSMTITTNDGKVRKVFDSKSGVKISEQSASGPARREGDVTGFNRKSQEFSHYVAQRQIAWPWLAAAAPAWTHETRSFSYQGAISTAMPGMAPLQIPMSSRIDITERGEGWAVGTMTVQTQGVGAPSQSAFVQGPGRPHGLWVSPDALAAMRPGVIDQDPHTGAVLAYQASQAPDGRAIGVITEQGPQYYSTYVYDMSDGVLLSVTQTRQDLGMTTELWLAGRH